ncbi:MAG TPA: cysteine desulfurase NifS [Verrucomicrobiales bacterium]|nr:cysteine desulfurase NifS [Verrucomicrobiales bacterium]
MRKTIYLDYNATTPLDPLVKAAMLPFLEDCYGNPSSVHHVGRKARALLDEARERVAKVWKAKPSEVVFTSGGTESNNLAILGSARAWRNKGRHLITSRIEHHAVLNCFHYLQQKEGFEVSYLPVDSRGLVSPDDLAAALRTDTILVSVMSANNEVGSIQPVSDLGALCRARGVLFHTDAVQWFGKEPFDSIHQFNADLVSCCSHKFHGPKGAGALFVRSPLRPDPILFGGSHENERRAGTENVPAVAGFALASEFFVERPVFDRSLLAPLSLSLVEALRSIPGLVVFSDSSSGLANTVSFAVPRSDSLTLLANLDLDGICASSGSACSAGSLNPSHVLNAMGASAAEANSLVRFSLGRSSSPADIAFVSSTLPEIIFRSQHLK